MRGQQAANEGWSSEGEAAGRRAFYTQTNTACHVLALWAPSPPGALCSEEVVAEQEDTTRI